MGTASGNLATVIYQTRRPDEDTVSFTTIVSVVGDSSDDIRYIGHVVGLEKDFDNVSLEMAVPRSLVGKAVLTSAQTQLLVNGETLADVRLTELRLPNRPNQSAISGAVYLDDLAVDIVAIDDPITLIFVAFGAVVVGCVVKFLATTRLLRDTFRAATVAGHKPNLVIETSTDGVTSVGFAERLKATLNCTVRGSVYSQAGERIEEDSTNEAPPA